MDKQERWDARFLELSKHVSTWSKDPSSKVGAVLIRDSNLVAMTAFNGFPNAILDDERLENRDIKYQIIVHAEENLIANSSKSGVSTLNAKVAVSMFPCSRCARLLISAGIKEIITQLPTGEFLDRWEVEIELSKKLIKEAGIKLVII